MENGPLEAHEAKVMRAGEHLRTIGEEFAPSGTSLGDGTEILIAELAEHAEVPTRFDACGVFGPTSRSVTERSAGNTCPPCGSPCAGLS